jgi:hypothetical protein
MRRKWSIKRTPQNIRSIQVQGEHNEAAQRCKTGLKDITHQILTSKSNLTMGDDGEWRINSTEDPLDINATDVNQDIGGASDISGPVETDINERADEYFQFVTPTLMGKVNDHMNNSIRRYDLNELKTYQVMFADLKTNPDGTYTVLWVDYKTGSVECVVIKSKTTTTAALTKIMVDRGVNKLPWATTLIYDGDGANNALSEAMSKIGIATMLGVPYRQSYNFAERIIGNISHVARKAVITAKLTPKWFGPAMEHAAHHHNYIHSRSRGSSPNEMVYGKQMGISHLMTFGQLVFVSKSESKRNDMKRKGATPTEAMMAKSEICMVTGYQRTLSRTYRLQTFRGTGATIHSKDVVSIRDNRDPKEINLKMFEDNLDLLKVWLEDEKESISVNLESTNQMGGANPGGDMKPWLTDVVLLDKLRKYVTIEGGGSFTDQDTVTGLCARFNQSRDELTELALEEEAKALTGQLYNIPTSKLNEDDGEPMKEDKGEPLFGKAGQDQIIPLTRGTRSGKQRVNKIIERDSEIEGGKDTDASIKRQVRFSKHDLIKEIPSNPNSIVKHTFSLREDEVYALGDLVVNRPVMDISTWNPVPSKDNGPYKGWSYACLHVLQKCLADEVAGLSRKKDMDWKEVLDTVHLKALGIAALNKELHSLTNKHQVLRELMEDDPDYATAKKEAVKGRAIFDIKRDDSSKVRVVKQGFLEPVARNQVFTGHVVSPISVRIAIASHKP